MILALTLTFFFSGAFAKDVWQYSIEKRGNLGFLNPGYIADKLTVKGKQGWELITVQQSGDQTWFFYKKKK